MNRPLSRTTPASRLPASVALSSTSVWGTPPTCSKTRIIDSQRHSDLCDMEQTQKRPLEWGKLTTSSWSATSDPPSTAVALP